MECLADREGGIAEIYVAPMQTKAAPAAPGAGTGVGLCFLGEARPARRPNTSHGTRRPRFTRHAAGAGGAVFLSGSLSPSRPPRLGRSLRSRHLRSASPKPKPSDHSPGFGACDEAEELAKRAGLWVTLSIDSGHQRAAPQLGFGNMHSKGTYQVYVTTLLEIIRSASLD